MSFLKSKYRSFTCAELRKENIGQEVTLSGWVARKRDHGGVIFVDLRDHYGATQVVFDSDLRNQIQEVRIESVICVKGIVRDRANDAVNPKIPTGEVEVPVTSLEILSEAKVLPFQVEDDDQAPELSRLKYRFLELRREKLHRNIMLRCKVIKEIRESMHKMGFFEFQTPILTSSSPEGARDYIVPSRKHPGKFFALPQAPQQFKQLIQVAGFDRYFQIAPCFRDEDARADRSPAEFYQLDLEMSFVEQDNVLKANEQCMIDVFSAIKPGSIAEEPFPRISYDKALEEFGSDKPDLRNPLRIKDVSSAFSQTEFKVFKSVIDDGGKVRAIKVKLDELPPRKYFDDQIEWFKKQTGQGIAYLNFIDDEVKGTILKFVSDKEQQALKDLLEIESGTNIVFFAASKDSKILDAFGKFRNKLAEDFSLLNKGQYHFVWITDYHLFEKNDEGKIEFSHNPFSMPRGGLEALNTKDPLEIYSDQYDLVCNGYELGSGAIRNYRRDIMYKAFEIAGYPNEVVDEKFGGMLNAFDFGAPPHGGFAHGVDRIVMLLSGEETIREVIMFPFAQSCEDLMMQAPSRVDQKQLDEVHIALNLPEEESTV
ncbi:MAG: aspartate--tRNA ligase [Bdellovibrionales bacterium]|nr:aspartate--tRNA ligase [Bdellovibrionales bacterium]